MAHREVGSQHHELFPVRESAGERRVDCPVRGCSVPFEDCRSCEHGTIVHLKGAPLPFVVCPAEGPARGLLPGPPDAEVRTIMKPVVTVPWDLTVAALIRTFIDEGVTAVVVVARNGCAAGLVTREQVVLDNHGWTQLRNAALSLWPEESQWQGPVESESELFLHDFLRSRTAAELMTREVGYVTPDALISAAAEVMGKTGLSHLPVFEQGRWPVGMLSAIEIAEWVAKRR